MTHIFKLFFWYNPLNLFWIEAFFTSSFAFIVNDCKISLLPSLDYFQLRAYSDPRFPKNFGWSHPNILIIWQCAKPEKYYQRLHFEAVLFSNTETKRVELMKAFGVFNILSFLLLLYGKFAVCSRSLYFQILNELLSRIGPSPLRNFLSLIEWVVNFVPPSFLGVEHKEKMRDMLSKRTWLI